MRYYEKNRDAINAKRRANPNRAVQNRKWRAANKDKTKAYTQRYESKNPNAKRDSAFKKKYGITVGDYDVLLALQDGRCDLCGAKSSPLRNGKPVRLCVDHDHKTGKVRSLLCTTCNRFVGLLERDRELTERIVAYLRQHK
jgi:hypothetical protein